MWVYLAARDRHCTHLCMSIWSQIWSDLRTFRIQNLSFFFHANDVRPKGDETKQVSEKHRSLGSWASDATRQCGAANKVVTQTRETPFKTVLSLDQVPWGPGMQSPVAREICPRYSWYKCGCTVPARLVIPSSSVKRDNRILQRCNCCKPLTGWSFWGTWKVCCQETAGERSSSTAAMSGLMWMLCLTRRSLKVLIKS